MQEGESKEKGGEGIQSFKIILLKHDLGICAWVLPVAWCLEQQPAQEPELELERGLELELQLELELELELEQGLERVWGQWSGGGTEEARWEVLRGAQELGQCRVEGQIVAEEVEWAGGSRTGTRRWGRKEAVGRCRSQLEAARSLQVRVNQMSET